MRGIRNRTVGTLVAVAMVIGWLVVAGIAAPYAGRLDAVANNDNAAFLPADAEATRADRLATGFIDRPTTPALVVYERTSGITDADRQRVAADADRFTRVPGVITPLPPPVPSQDGQAIQLIVPLDSSGDGGDRIHRVVDAMRDITGPGADGLLVEVAGPAGLLADLVAVFSSIDGPLLLVTLVVVLVILLIVYRSPVLWIIPLLAAGVSYVVATLLVYVLAQNEVIKLNGQAQGILTVLVFGAGTDYALLLIARYREELHHHPRTLDAIIAAWRGAGPAIIASGSTVIAGLLCLLLSDLNSNRALGPVTAVGVGVTLVVMLTFLPALLLLGGRWAFWPRVPHAGTTDRSGAVWRATGRFIGRRARLVWPLTAAALIALAAGLTQLGGTTLGQADLFTEQTDAVDGQRIIDRHFPGGLGSPATIFVAEGSADRVADVARAVPGVVQVQPLTVAPGAGGQADPAAGPQAAPKVVDGRIQLEATLAEEADSLAARDTVRRLREAVHAVPDAGAVVGGFTAINIDTSDAADRDQNVIIPTVLGVIAVILALLLRSLLAPLLLIVTVVLSFAATLGLCAVLFTHGFDFPGVDASFPLFAFVFLVALGVDYNIFLMTRVREESAKYGTRQGVLRGLCVTGGVITSAGFVLAATFSALAVLPLVILVELGLAVALGVLIDTIIVRSLLVPALAYHIGPAIWWPSRLGRVAEGEPPDDPDYRARHAR
ncbi:MMPL family transporter [Micromonospora sp. NBC_01699]|uniref:MMPL family transporter n=1 Tax=Micromonospora sp. NBC_01699 TaxID=2975984 RepID=UPI002E34326A|nr:MMPL family transporter [Micromonospora sp. NBC_01699]